MTNLNTLPLSILSRPARGETPESRLTRLAAKATAEGCRLVIIPGSGRFVSRVGVTSGSTAGLYYIVDLDRRSCSCRAEGACKHLALVLDQIGLLEPVAA